MYRVEHDSVENSVNSYDSINDSNDQIDNLSDSKICSEFSSGEPVDLKPLKRRLKNPEFVCNSCGRSASEKSSLCWPETL